ncbi:hypothetical protein CDV53_11135 [Haematobacter missouriensis]|uniref:Uncharacterized protein n=1 Tax=Haematobacter missouriensis TaxID=366616 RepID=A0ABX3ZSL1_9RHOB|nr:hypothetical protein CDV53_11135 [Haematobacter missouriensis]
MDFRLDFRRSHMISAPARQPPKRASPGARGSALMAPSFRDDRRRSVNGCGKQHPGLPLGGNLSHIVEEHPGNRKFWLMTEPIFQLLA